MLSSAEEHRNAEAVGAAGGVFLRGSTGIKEELMVGMRSDRARGRARNLLAAIAPLPEDVEFCRLRELAIDYIKEAERLEAENKGHVTESDELISTALDAVARDYFERALTGARPKRNR
jgi:hypothetical protein